MKFQIKLLTLLLLTSAFLKYADSRKRIKKMSEALVDVKDRVQEMQRAQIVQDSKMQAKLGEIESNVAKLQPHEETTEDKAIKISGAVEKAASGLPELVSGIQTRNYKAIILGGMKMVTSILGLFFPGAELIANAVIGTLSSLFSLFSSTKTPQAESPWKSALDQFKLEGIQEDIAGIEYSWNSVIKSVIHFEDFLNNKDVITEELASSFYEISFNHIEIFGKLEKFVHTYCMQNTHSGDEGKKNVDGCLGLLVSYARLANHRSIMLARMAGIALRAETYYKDLFEKEDEGPLKKEYTRKKIAMEKFKENFVYLAEQQRKMDKDVLRPFGDPLNEYQSKIPIYELYSNPNQYTVLLQYLLNLDIDYKYFIDNDCAVLCPDAQFGGLCTRVQATGSYQTWEGSILPVTSIFVPKGLALSIKGNKVIGPLYGMFAYTLPADLTDITHVKIEKILSDPNFDASETIIMCNKNDICDTFDTELRKPIKLSDYHGMDFTTVKNIYVPEDIKATLFKLGSDKKTKEKYNGPLVGPFKQEGITACASDWQYLEIAETAGTEDGKKMVVMCGTENFCVQFEAGSNLDKQDDGWIFGWFKDEQPKCLPEPEKNKVSLRIPVGRQVTILKGEKGNLGPFTGPAFFPSIDAKDLKMKVENLWLGNKKRSGVAALLNNNVSAQPKSQQPRAVSKRHHHHKLNHVYQHYATTNTTTVLNSD